MTEHSASLTSNYEDRPNRLFIEDALDDDNSIARLSSKTMDKLQLFCGDTVKLKGKKQRETICIVLSDDSCRDDRIRINNVVQNNLCVHLGNGIVIEGCEHVKYGARVHVLPIDDTIKDFMGNLLQDCLQPYFRDAFRPVCVNDMFTVRAGMHCVEFKVIDTEPSPYCIVAPETVICCEGTPIERQLEEASIDEIDFDDIGGLEDIKQCLKEFIQYPFQYEEIYHRFGMAPSRGVLLYGPPGCGKSMLVKALANECNIKLITSHTPELIACMTLNTIEDNVRNVFDEARKAAPCILFIDSLDCSIATPEKVTLDRLINQIRTEMDGLNIRTKVFVIAATNRPDMIDPTIFRPGRLDQKIYVPLPDERSRHSIFKIISRKYPLAEDVDLTFLTGVSAGASGADVIELCQRACKMAIRESIEKEQKLESQDVHNSLNTDDSIGKIRREHFEKAMDRFRRSISDNDIRMYNMFAQTWRSRYGCNSSFPIFNFPQNITEGNGVNQKSANYTDDDDLYG